MTRNRYKFAPAPAVKSKYDKSVDEWASPTKLASPPKNLGIQETKGDSADEHIGVPEDFPKLLLAKRRNCCMRIICLVCCCKT